MTHGAPNDGYAFQTCSDYSFNFRHKNHTAVAIINLFVFFKDRRCLMLSRDNTISQQLSVVNIKSQEKQKRFVPRSKGAKNTTVKYLCYVSRDLCLVSFIDLSLASNTIGVNVFRDKKHLRLGLARCFVTKLGKNLLRGLAPCCPDQVRCSLCLFIPDRNLIQSRNTLCNRVYFWPLPCGNS